MEFGGVWSALRKGIRIRRASWPEGVWIRLAVHDLSEDGPYLYIRTSKANRTPFVLTSEHILAEDWEEMPERRDIR